MWSGDDLQAPLDSIQRPLFSEKFERLEDRWTHQRSAYSNADGLGDLAQSLRFLLAI